MTTSDLRRRSFLSGAAFAALFPGAAMAQAGERSDIAAAEAALARAERSRDIFEIGKARIGVAIELRGPFFGQTPQDYARAMDLLAANHDPALLRVSPTAWGLSRLYWSEMAFDQKRALRMRLLPAIRAAARDAAKALPTTTRAAVRVANIGLSGALIDGDLIEAARWVAIGDRAAGTTTAVEGDDSGIGLLDENVSTFYALAGRHFALKGDLQGAWRGLEASKWAAPSAPRLRTARHSAEVVKAAARVRQGISGFDAVAGLIVSPAGSSLLIATPQSAEDRIIDLRGDDGVAFDETELQTLLWGSLWRETFMRGALGGWMGAYAADDGPAGTSTGNVFRRELPKLAHSLWAYAIGPIVRALTAAGVARGARVALILPSAMAQMPFRMATDPRSGQSIIDLHSIAEFPDVATLAASALGRAGKAATLSGLFNPTGDLPGAEAEKALVEAEFPAGAITTLPPMLSGPAFLKRLRGSGAAYAYLASHGAFGVQSNAQSGIALGAGKSLTVDHVLGEATTLPVRLVVLSACETGKASMALQQQPSHLPNALLGRGAKGVIAALWKVADAPTALLMRETMRRHLDLGEHPATALTQAQKWLRDSNAQTFVDSLILAMETAPDRDWSAVERLTADISTFAPDEAPYRDPYHWAGFAYYGS